jgi:GDP-4-dehydro-6-deoxy-D-mannose reductase
MRVLVTGITGFAGGHLAEALLAKATVELHGLSRTGRWPEPLRHLAESTRLLRCDLADGSAVRALLEETRPEQIYHLAAYAHAGKSLHDAEAAWAANLTATRQLYEAVAAWGGRPRILYVCSGLIYGDLPGPDQTQDEDCPLRPASPYASSKAAADLISYQYTRTHQLDVVRVRPFNHFGPRQSTQYAVAHFARQLAAIEAGRQPPVLETGNLQTHRDLTDVRDVVGAYVQLMEHGRTGEAYNVASGRAWSMQAVLDRLLGLVRVPVTVRQCPGLMRAAETSIICGNPAKLRRETGWAPAFSLDQTLQDTLEYWRAAVAST